ncbi:DUF2334 domain-containing protein [Caenimonas sedimenti]|uniref:DUF2334 domain-containing protein n=1 Tax=Caenimonas sedimenti TaxID=2596921 RepID=A0A562ZSN9_9BURK|nr:DUF2334 domain-containing protein [Caenimonas sedimenti]TWO71610.1 DUF2334 domain-containing protein [Caenimonas sedimenti]
MKLIRRFFLALVACTAFLGALPAQAQTTVPKVLALYDAPSGTEWDKLGMAYAIMLRNLLGHFNAQVDLVPVQQYTAGRVNNYQATFYLGAAYDHQIPAAFLNDAMTTTKTVVWFKYNIWQLAWNAQYNFTANKGISFYGLRGLNAQPSSSNPNPGFFDTVKYKNLDFVKYYTYDAGRNAINSDPDIGWTAIADPAKATAVVSVANPKAGEVAPYIVRAGNFWYVADLPFSFIGPRDRYLVFSDLLHDMLGINHAESHKAMVRLEDVGAMVDTNAMKTLTDYMASKAVPFSIAVIPHYMDPLGLYNGGTPQSVTLSQATNLRKSLDYARQKAGAEMVMHGYTHQYGSMRNPHTGVSGDDYEFWDIVNNRPVPEDSTSWALGRLNAGLRDMRANGYNPVAWETPHYHASPLASKAVPQVFGTTYQRVVYFTADKPNFFAPVGKDFSVGQIFPYVIGKDYYGQRVLPENLGNIEYDISTIDPTSNYNYTADDLITNARYALAVRDGFASFFFHPFWLEPAVGTPGFADFKKTVEGITALGYTWVKPSQLP